MTPSWRASMPALCAAGAVGGGTVLGGIFGPRPAGMLAAAFCAAAALASVLGMRRSRLGAAAALVALATAAGAGASWRSAAEARRLLPRLAEDAATPRVCGSVTAVSPRSISLDARTVEAEARSWRVREPLRIVGARPGDGGWSVRAGHAACVSGRLRPARSAREPPILVASSVQRMGTASRVRVAASTVRAGFVRAAGRALPEDRAGLLLGMTVGDTTLIDEQTTEAFRTTGLAHLVAVSGSNVAVLLALVLAGVRLVAARGRWIRVGLAAPPLAFFAFVTGLEPSVLRAVVTAGLVLAVTASGRTADALRAAAVAFAVLVLVSPDLLARPGFQLSFAATIGLVLWSGPLTERIARVIGGRDPPGPVTALAGLTGTTAAAQIAVAPLLAWHFGAVPALGAVANLLVAPLAGFVMVGGVVTLGAAWLIAPLAFAPALMRLPLDAILWTGRSFARLPLASLEVVPVAGVAILAAGIAAGARRSATRLAAGAVAVCALGGSCGAGFAAAPARCEEEVRVVDVGQGTAVLLRSREHAVLVDGGPEGAGVVHALRDAGVRKVDVFVVTHPHADHTEGLEEVLPALGAREIVGPPTVAWGVGEKLVRLAHRKRVPVRVVAAGAEIRAGPRIRIEVVGPQDDEPPEESPDLINPWNLVLRATVGEVTVLLPGDVDTRGTSDLLASGRSARAPVLVAPHHGSADLDPAFVDEVGPRLTIVSVGRHNRYGHPTRRALGIYARHGPVLRTDRDGTVVVCGSSGTLQVYREGA